MARILPPSWLVFIFCAVTGNAHATDARLTLAQAVELALSENDPSVAQYLAKADSVQAGAVADAQLPDPKLRFGVANLAIDSFRFSQEPMSQLQLGLHQSFPTAGKRRSKRARGEANSDAYRFMAGNQSLLLELEVERLWLKLHHLQKLSEIVTTKKIRLSEILGALDAKFESGEAGAHSVLAVEAELALLEDRLEVVTQNIEEVRVQLARYIGTVHAGKHLAGSYADIPPPKGLPLLEQGISDHPGLLQEKAFIRAHAQSVMLATENYRPNWGVDLGYGYRAAGRADFASAMVTLDLPLFPGKRQDRRLAAAKQSKQAAQFKLQAKELDMIRNIRTAYTVWRKSSDRISLYETVVLARTQAASEAVENSYASGRIGFAEIMRAHVSELDALLKLEAIKLERAFAQVQLKYYEGKHL